MTTYFDSLMKWMVPAYEFTSASAEKGKSRQKPVHDTKVRGAHLTIGDRVLVKIVAFDGTQNWPTNGRRART